MQHHTKTRRLLTEYLYHKLLSLHINAITTVNQLADAEIVDYSCELLNFRQMASFSRI